MASRCSLTLAWRRSRCLFSVRSSSSSSFSYLSQSQSQTPPSFDTSGKVCDQVRGFLTAPKQFRLNGCCYMHTGRYLCCAGEQSLAEKTPGVSEIQTPGCESGMTRLKRTKLKGKRAVVKWLKYFRWKKKKEYQRMTAEEKILYKLKKVKTHEFICPTGKVEAIDGHNQIKSMHLLAHLNKEVDGDEEDNQCSFQKS